MIDLLIRVNKKKKLFILSHIKNYDNYGCGRVGQRYTETTKNSDICGKDNSKRRYNELKYKEYEKNRVRIR